MSQVALLDPLVAQQVAAGEVVDRPASVVKELSENALDAGATRVEVEIADGGRERMLLRDDGSGMSEEDAKLSVLRHATSKIRTASDIETVMTLGFRGEALPSIASVCAFSLTTSTGEGAGTNVVADGTGSVTVSPASHPKGTTVLVDRLFYNVPARRAFLKSARAERAASPNSEPPKAAGLSEQRKHTEQAGAPSSKSTRRTKKVSGSRRRIETLFLRLCKRA